MSMEQQIKKALADIEMAQVHNRQAADFYYRAKERLENLYSPAAPKRGKRRLSKDQVARTIAKRLNSISNSKVKTYDPAVS